jgi:uncharacterized damage-inducible protein DinB
MPINESLISELEQETKLTKRLLERVPIEKADWKAHEKSMSLGRLATHVAEIPGWITSTLGADEMDFAKFDYKPRIAKSNAELIEIFEENRAKGLESLKNAKDEDFSKDWTMRNGEQVYFTMPKIAVIRTYAFNHLYHHRGQLTVNLRLLNVPLPYIYGPTADEPM